MSVSAEDVVKNLVVALQLSQQMGVSIRQVADAVSRSHDEGRELTDEEIQFFADSAREAVERI